MPGALQADGPQAVDLDWLPPRDSNPDMLIQSYREFVGGRLP